MIANSVEGHLATWATIAVGAITFAGALRWLIVAALRPQLDRVHRRIDEHMRIEESDAAEFRLTQTHLANTVTSTAEHLARLDEKLERIDERTARNEQQLAHLAGKTGTAL